MAIDEGSVISGLIKESHSENGTREQRPTDHQEMSHRTPTPKPSDFQAQGTASAKTEVETTGLQVRDTRNGIV